MKYASIFIMLLSAVGFSCKKTQEIEVKGRTIERYKQQGVESAIIELAYAPLSYGSVSSGFETLLETQSDEQGGFAFSFEEPTTANYRIRARKQGYLLSEQLVSATDWATNTSNVVELTMISEASLSIHFFNDDDPDATVLFKIGKHSEGCSSCCLEQQSYTVMGISDTTIDCEMYGNQMIEYEVTRISGGSNQVELREFALQMGENLIDIAY